MKTLQMVGVTPVLTTPAGFLVSVYQEDDQEVIEPFYSYYEARPNYTQIGGQPEPPSWLGQ